VRSKILWVILSFVAISSLSLALFSQVRGDVCIDIDHGTWTNSVPPPDSGCESSVYELLCDGSTIRGPVNTFCYNRGCTKQNCTCNAYQPSSCPPPGGACVTGTVFTWCDCNGTFTEDIVTCFAC
jgi:hypothetical protein